MPPSEQSSIPSTVASALARQLFTRETGGDVAADAAVAAAERICALIADGLSRWFGPYGSHALVTRALARVQAQHPVLTGVKMTEARCLTGLADAARVHGGQATTDGVVAMMAALAELIGRLIGDDLAVGLLQQSMTTSSTSGRMAPGATATDDVPQTMKQP